MSDGGTEEDRPAGVQLGCLRENEEVEPYERQAWLSVLAPQLPPREVTVESGVEKRDHPPVVEQKAVTREVQNEDQIEDGGYADGRNGEHTGVTLGPRDESAHG